MYDLPDSTLERAQMLETILLAACEGKREENGAYKMLRQIFIEDDELAKLLPDFVRTSRNLDGFWAYIKPKSPQWAPRREIVRDAFLPLFDHLEGATKIPLDETVNEALATFDAAGVHAAWRKAVARRHSDPEGAITSARTLLETVCKRVLDKMGVEYDDTADLPALYRLAATSLNLAPSQHSEETFKRILGGCTNVVESLGALRNKLGDAHGKGGTPVRVSPRHAQLAVNMAGAAATFIVETWNDTKASFRFGIVDHASGMKVEATGRTQAEAEANAEAKLREFKSRGRPAG